MKIQVWTLDEMKAAADAAHALGIPVVGHCRNASSTRDPARRWEIGADVGAEQPERLHRTVELLDRRIDILHRQGRGAAQPLGITPDQFRYHVIVCLREGDRIAGRNIMEIGERVGTAKKFAGNGY